MTLVGVDRLTVAAGPPSAPVPILRGVSFSIEPGKTLGIVGESGCGKSMTALALMGLLPEGARAGGSIRFDGRELLADPHAWQGLRGKRIAMIFQEPMTALNPVLTIGEQIAEILIVHENETRANALVRAADLLRRVGIAEPKRRAAAYPHELSGGMRQRVMIAMAIACAPDLLIADEPTTALDVSVEAQILDLLLELQADSGLALMLISHNFAVIGEMSDEVLVMYAGRAVERGGADAVLKSPVHPYTQALLAAIPRIGASAGRLPAIPGVVPHPRDAGAGCGFAPRCALASDECRAGEIALRPAAPGHSAACVRV